MYPRNNVAPERIAVGQVVFISDGTIQSAGVSITVRGQGGAEATGAGTTVFGADNTVYYTPTQAETDFSSFVVIASKASCFSVSQTIVTTASATAGQVRLEGVTHTDAVVPTVSTLTGNVDGSVNSVTTSVSADLISINGVIAAADNLQANFDGTGYTDDNAPATQSQVGKLSTGSAAISTAAESATVTTAAETLTFASTKNLDGVYHELADVAGQIDAYYQFDVGGNGVGVSTTMSGRMTGNGDDLGIFAYNWGTTSWDQIFSLVGSNSADDVEVTRSILKAHTGTGANLGKIRIRAYAASGLTSATLYLDQVYLSYSVVSQSVGYALGRVWINSDSANTSTETYVDGVADNTVSTVAAATTIADNLGIKDFHVTSNSALALVADMNGYNVFGIGYSLSLGGQDLAGTHVYHASPVNGIATTAGVADHFDLIDSIIDVVTIDDAHFTDCIFKGTYTQGTSGIVNLEVNINHCKSGIAGAAAPIFTKTAGATLTMSVRDWKGGFTQNGLQAGDVVTIGGTELGTITLTGTGGTVEIRGIYKELVTSGFSGTVNTDGAILASDVAAILAVIGTAGAGLTDLGGMSLGMKAEVNAEAKDVIATDTYGEPVQGTPGEVVSLEYKIGLIYKMLINEKNYDGSNINILNYAATVTDQKRAASQALGVYTEENIITGL